MFKTNEGCLDRLIRVTLGVVLLTAFYYNHNYYFLIGIIPLLTGYIGWCGLYTVLGISTICKKN